MTFELGYGTNGFANHRLHDALAVIADLGYTGVALTLDHHHLDPYGPNVAAETERVAARLDALGLRVVVETGARYLLDPTRKHHPTLVSDDQDTRVDFLLRAADIAADLGADCVSFWSGVSDVDEATAWKRLRDGVARLLDACPRVPFGLEPEPGMAVQHLTEALTLRTELGEPEMLGITLDVGHCVAVEPDDAATCVRQAGELLVNVQLDDMVHGVHEHLEFGAGTLDLAATLAALTEVGYTGLAAVELPRHSHAAPDVARRSMAALRAAMDPPWLVEAEARVRADAAAIRSLFPAVGRHVGRDAVRPRVDARGWVHGTADDLARARLIAALPDASELPDLYRYGDDAEKRGVLRGLRPSTDPSVGVPIVQDALRTNDPRLVAAAMGPFAAAHLDRHAWRHGVLKCLFMGIPLGAVSRLDDLADAELARMVADFAAERHAAGRAVPVDATDLLRKARA
ncbi:EboA domain-containing protein [Actinokineospora sp. UTMC 2448]|uniref:EboA domain-containing protein n=1 Tax=Actinokineospora sp. UTMC 2448 TaxID=2268449 RepID=UPI0021642EBB|nr:EboA domain-containing protein [Actinokineospora sp. UTMC 2448]UVS81968.1 Xylose isomerase [Actinokineospora sp. UTMC 2448]